MLSFIKDFMQDLCISIKLSFEMYWFLWVLLFFSLGSYMFSYCFFGFKSYGFIDFIDFFILQDSSSKVALLAVLFATMTALITLTININEVNNNKKYDELLDAYKSIIDGYDNFDSIISNIMSNVLHVSVFNFLFEGGKYSSDKFDEIRYESYHNLINKNHELDSCLNKNRVKQLIYSNELIRKKIDLLGEDKIYGIALEFSKEFKEKVVDFIYESNDSAKIDINVGILDSMVNEYRKKSYVSIANMAVKIKGEKYKKNYINLKNDIFFEGE